MHVGRTYPYLPDYWATECWFWPGWCPWKFYVVWLDPPPAPWDVLGYPFAIFTDEGDTVPDRTQAFWGFRVDSDPFAYRVRLSQEMIIRDGQTYARSKLQAREIPSGTEIANAWLYQPFPQYSQDLWGHGWSLADDPNDTGPKFFVDLRPAVYSEVGSPFPLY